MLRRVRLLLLASALGLIAGSHGCSRIVEPNSNSLREAFTSVVDRGGASAVAGGHGEFYPLQLGNRWHYVYSYSARFLPADGSAPEALDSARSTSERTLVCTQEVDGRSYTIERQRLKSGARTLWVAYRQDRTGLYELFARPAPPPCDSTTSSDADPGSRSADERVWKGTAAREGLRDARRALESRIASLTAARVARPVGRELQRLRYPLHAGARWNVLPWPLLSAEVEGVDVLDLPTGRVSAYRIRYRGETLGANDQVRVWYGRGGYLGLAGHFQYELTDPVGTRIGTVVGEFSEVLDEISLNTPPSFEGPRGSRLITEAKEALGAVLTGEQVHYQRFGTFADAADATDLRVKLGVELGELSTRWAFSVRGASVTGFVATARGRDDTRAEGIVVSLRYVRGQSPVWTVRRGA